MRSLPKRSALSSSSSLSSPAGDGNDGSSNQHPSSPYGALRIDGQYHSSSNSNNNQHSSSSFKSGHESHRSNSSGKKKYDASHGIMATLGRCFVRILVGAAFLFLMAYIMHLFWVNLLLLARSVMPQEQALPEFELHSGEVLVPDELSLPSQEITATVASAKAIAGSVTGASLKESSTFSGIDSGGNLGNNNNEQGWANVPGNSDKFKLPLPRIIITIVPQLYSVTALKRVCDLIRRAERPHPDIEVALVFWLDWASSGSPKVEPSIKAVTNSSLKKLIDFASKFEWSHGPKTVRVRNDLLTGYYTSAKASWSSGEGTPSTYPTAGRKKKAVGRDGFVTATATTSTHRLGFDKTDSWQLFNAWDHRFPFGISSTSLSRESLLSSSFSSRDFFMVISDNVDAVPRLYLKRVAPLLFAQVEATHRGLPLDAPLLGVNLLGISAPAMMPAAARTPPPLKTRGPPTLRQCAGVRWGTLYFPEPWINLMTYMNSRQSGQSLYRKLPADGGIERLRRDLRLGRHNRSRSELSNNVLTPKPSIYDKKDYHSSATNTFDKNPVLQQLIDADDEWEQALEEYMAFSGTFILHPGRSLRVHMPFLGLEYKTDPRSFHHEDKKARASILTGASVSSANTLHQLASIESFSASGERFLLDSSLSGKHAQVGKGDEASGMGFEVLAQRQIEEEGNDKNSFGSEKPENELMSVLKSSSRHFLDIASKGNIDMHDRTTSTSGILLVGQSLTTMKGGRRKLENGPRTNDGRGPFRYAMVLESWGEVAVYEQGVHPRRKLWSSHTSTSPDHGSAYEEWRRAIYRPEYVQPQPTYMLRLESGGALTLTESYFELELGDRSTNRSKLKHEQVIWMTPGGAALDAVDGGISGTHLYLNPNDGSLAVFEGGAWNCSARRRLLWQSLLSGHSQKSHFLCEDQLQSPSGWVSRFERLCSSFSPKLLNGATSRNGLTVFLSTYSNFETLALQLHYYAVSPVVRRIVVAWRNANMNPPTPARIGHVTVYFTTSDHGSDFSSSGGNNLNDRFLPSFLVSTDAVLVLDDDIKVHLQDINLLYEAWRRNRRKIVGFFPRWIDVRRSAFQGKGGKRDIGSQVAGLDYLPESEDPRLTPNLNEGHVPPQANSGALPKAGYGLMKGKVMMLHRDLLWFYTCPEVPSQSLFVEHVLPASTSSVPDFPNLRRTIQNVVDRTHTCEDIGMSIMAAAANIVATKSVEGAVLDANNSSMQLMYPGGLEPAVLFVMRRRGIGDFGKAMPRKGGFDLGGSHPKFNRYQRAEYRLIRSQCVRLFVAAFLDDKQRLQTNRSISGSILPLQHNMIASKRINDRETMLAEIPYEGISKRLFVECASSTGKQHEACSWIVPRKRDFTVHWHHYMS